MRFLRNTSISNKVLIAPVIMVMALGTVLMLALYGLNKQRSVLNQVHEIALERTTLVNEFIASSEQVQSDVFRISVLNFMKLPDKEIQPVYVRFAQGLNNMGVIYGQILTKWMLDQKEKEILEQMGIPMEAFRHEAQQASGVVSQNPSIGVLLVRSVAVPFADFRRLLTEFLNYQKEKIVHAQTISKRTSETIRTTITVIALFTAFGAIIITVLIGTRFISRPIRSITDVMNQLAEGELSVEVGGLKRQDEIGSMAKAIEVFRENAIEKSAAEAELQKHREHLEELVEQRTKALLAAQEELVRKEKLAAIGELSGNISHELKNSLGVIDSSVYYLKMKLKDGEEKVKTHLERIRSAIISSDAVIRSLSDLTRMKEPDLEKLNIIEFVSSTIEASNLPEMVKVVEKFPEGKIFIDADPDTLGMAFKNIIDNAISSMDEKGTLTLMIGRTDGDQVEVSFTDTGPGIVPENLDKIFQPLFTTRARGMGFGLSITRMIIEKHGGRIDVKSEAGKGATLTVHLPVDINPTQRS